MSFGTLSTRLRSDAMTPERAYGLALKIASETYDQIIALGDDPAPEQAAGRDLADAVEPTARC
jgi:hypothetical protein